MSRILITGATNGIGLVTATELAAQGHELILANRNREKAEDAVSNIKAQSPDAEVTLLDLDLSSLDSVRQCASDFHARFDSLDILLNNAGMTAHEEVITADGIESQFAVNNVAQLLLTMELLPALEKAAPSHVIFVTSLMHKFGKIDLDSIHGWKKYNANAAYAQSKLAMMFNAAELADRLAQRGISVNTLHPGAVATGIIEGYPPIMRAALRLFFTTPEKGARTSLHVASLEAEERPTGIYFNKCRPEKPGKQLQNSKLQKQVWEASCALCAIPAEM